MFDSCHATYLGREETVLACELVIRALCIAKFNIFLQVRDQDVSWPVSRLSRRMGGGPRIASSSSIRPDLL